MALKLNMGCGQHKLAGYVNVDKAGDPDVVCDLESFPWPWDDDSVEEAVFHHVLEHLGESRETYLGIIRELYRVCRPDALVKVVVPHPRSDDFLNDPTHVRAVTPDSMHLFSKSLNREWETLGVSNTPLGLYLDVDLELERVDYRLDEPWNTRFRNGELSQDEIIEATRQLNNVVKQIEMEIRVRKP